MVLPVLDALTHRGVVRSALLAACAFALAGGPAPAGAQQFEEISPQIEEMDSGGNTAATGQQGQQGGGATVQFEEIEGSVEEMDGTESPQPSGPAESEPLRMEMSPEPAAAQGPDAEPVVESPRSPQPTAQGRQRTQAQTSVQLPTSNISLDREFQDQIRSLNQQISVLKERVIEAKSRLLSYSQKVAQGFASGTQLFMKVENNLGNDFIIERLVFYLDGHQVFTREFEPDEEVDEILAYKGSVLPGRHRIDVDAILHGDDGMFDFGHSARLRLESGEYFAANEGKIVELNLVLFDRGGVFKAIDSRPALKFEIVERDVF